MAKITIHSYKGGTGKTTIATNLAKQLSDLGHKVLLVETDYIMPVYYGIFTKIKPIRFFSEIYEKSILNLKDLIYSVLPRLDVIFANPNFTPEDPIFKMDQDFFGRKIQQLIRITTDIEKDYDYILFDTAPGWNFPLIGNLLVSDLVIVILRPNIYEVKGTIRLVNELYRKARLTKDLTIFSLFNQIPDADYEERFQEWKQQLIREKIPIIGEIDCSCELSRDLGWGVTLVPSGSFLYDALGSLIRKLAKNIKF